jgi:hypothetical protein
MTMIIACLCALTLCGFLTQPSAVAQARPAQQTARTWFQYAPHVARDAPLASGNSPGTPAGCKTGIGAVNTDLDASSAITVTLFPQDGSEPFVYRLPLTPAGGAEQYYLPTISGPPSGKIYAAVIESDHPVGAMIRTDCDHTGRAASYSAPVPATEVTVPLAMKNFNSQCSYVSVQNTDTTAAASFGIDLYAVGSSTPIVSRRFEVSRGTSRTLNLCDSSAFDLLPDRYIGSARVTSVDGRTRFAVQAYVDIVLSRQAMYSFEGVPSERAASELYAPLFRSRQPLNRHDPATKYMDTGIAVANANDTPVDITVTYYGAQGSAECVGKEFTQRATIAATSSAVFYQGPGAQPVTGRHPLPANCVGSAKINAVGGKILAIVNDSLNFIDQSAAYNAFSASDASTRLVLPLFRTGHSAWNLWTGISVMNVGTGAASTVLVATNQDGTVTSGLPGMSIAGVEPMHTAIYWPDMVQRSGGGWARPAWAYGSATITSEQPVVAIVNDASLSQKADAATYGGIAWPETTP